jgi:hypothetical protein
LGVVRVESGIQVAFHSREIDGVVFEAGMIAHDADGEKRKKEERDDVAGAVILKEFQFITPSNTIRQCGVSETLFEAVRKF